MLNTNSVKMIEQQIPNFAFSTDLAKVDVYARNIQNKLSELTNNINTNYYNSKAVDDWFSRFDSNCSKNYIKQTVYNNDNKKVEKQINGLENRLMINTENVSSNKANITDLTSMMRNKIEKSEFYELKNYTNLLCKYDDLKDLYSKVMPSIKNFEDNMILLNQDMHRNSQIIRRFDEIINEKANKVAINDVYEHLSSKYVSDSNFKDKIQLQDDKIQELNSTVENLEDTFQKLNNVIDMEIKSAIRKQMSSFKHSTTSKAPTVTNGVTFKEIDDLMVNKVDRSEMELVLNLKSNKTDTNTNMVSIDIMHKHIKHLAVLIIEILRSKTMRYLKSEESEATVK